MMENTRLEKTMTP